MSDFNELENGSPRDASWMHLGKCTEMDSNLFFPSDGAGVEVAKKICAECQVKAECLSYALANRIEHGVWGGTSERQRRRILKRRKLYLSATNN